MDKYLGNSTNTKFISTYSETKDRLNAFANKLKSHIFSLTFPYLFIMTKF